VSEEGTAVPTASCPERSAATQAAMIRWSTSGRAASWNSTPRSSEEPRSPEESGSPEGPSAASATRVESDLAAPPGSTAVTFSYEDSMALTWSTYPAAITTRTSSMSGAAQNAATQCSSSDRPSSVSNCFGSAAPSR
jgi:hypothetical protein